MEEEVLEQVDRNRIVELACNLANIALTYHDMDQSTKGLELYEQAVAIFSKLGAASDVAEAIGNMAAMHVALGNLEKATEYCRDAIARHESLGYRQNTAHIHETLARVYAASGNHERARRSLDTARSLYESRNDVGKALEIARMLRG